ncbi:hypothetical protein SAMN04488005_2185 [Yoonia tamlensis]|uniref:Uncharacterized protein n=2 Tax=Yoonia tamlensis TaxID=390270 RepID=A0A1I6GUB7_9RHOB|nr:hypothetical protein SAMN04488005_2185 [Yoonia tamlensis]
MITRIEKTPSGYALIGKNPLGPVAQVAGFCAFVLLIGASVWLALSGIANWQENGVVMVLCAAMTAAFGALIGYAGLANIRLDGEIDLNAGRVILRRSSRIHATKVTTIPFNRIEAVFCEDGSAEETVQKSRQSLVLKLRDPIGRAAIDMPSEDANSLRDVLLHALGRAPAPVISDGKSLGSRIAWEVAERRR